LRRPRTRRNPVQRLRHPGRRTVSPELSGTDLITLNASELAARLANNDISSVEATQAHLDRIAAIDGDLHAFLHISADALATAEAVDRDRAAGAPMSPLA